MGGCRRSASLATSLLVNLNLLKRSSRHGIGCFWGYQDPEKHKLMGIINSLDVKEKSSDLTGDEFQQKTVARLNGP